MAAAAALAAVLSGCTQSGSPDRPTASRSATTPSATKPSTAATPPGLPSGVTPARVPATVANNIALRRYVTMKQCTAEPGGWKATGTASNPHHTSTTYTITVFFTTSSATVINTQHTKITVAPNSTTKWTVSKKFTAPAKTRCVLTGVA